MSELCWTPMTELSRMIAAKKVSPVEVVQAHLDRIAALDGKLKCYITVMGESALAGGRAVATNVFRHTASGWRLWIHHASPVITPTEGTDDSS